MQKVPTVRERQYEVTSAQVCVVTAPDGSLIGVAEPRVPAYFVAGASTVELSNAAAVVKPMSLPARRFRRLRKWKQACRVLLPKYEACESGADIASVQTAYVADIEDGVWRYSLAALKNGDGLFSSVVSLRDFLAELPALNSGKNMFSGCVLSLCSVKTIACSVPVVEQGVLTLGIDIRYKNSSALAGALTLLESKGWTLEIQYNTPAGVPTLAELEYLESDGTANILIPVSKIMGDETFTQEADIQFFSRKRTLVGFLGTPALYWGSSQNGYFELGGGIVADNVPFSRSRIKYSTTRNGSLWVATLTDGDWSITRTGYPSNLPEQWKFGLFSLASGQEYGGSIRIWACSISCGTQEFDFIPVLDECGTACLFDKKSRGYFYAEGTGQFAWELKSAMMNRRSRFAAPVLLPRSPVWGRLRDGSPEWCHYTTDTTGWQQFASVEEALENLGTNYPM